ncbi:WD40 repeat-like protein, partial [Kappamyces sp. JEL0680]
IFSGKINDLAWDFESKRLIGVGEGKDKFGHAFLFDSASSVGEISGHSKAINSVSLRPGFVVPFKYNKSLKDHSRFVQCVQYSATGDHFLSAASDSKIFLYDGKTGDKVCELVDGHKGTVFSVSWADDSASFISASADMTCKIWDVATQKVVNTIGFSDKPSFENQQVGSLWSGSFVISASLSGDLNYIDPRAGSRPVRVVKGHQRGITSLTVTPSKQIYSGSYDGKIYGWEMGQGGGIEIQGSGHSNQVVALAHQGDKVYSCGMDDSFRSLSIKEKSFDASAVQSTGSIPKSMSVVGSLVAVVTGASEVVLYENGAKKGTLACSGYSPTAVAISTSGAELAVGGEDNKVHLYSLPDFSPKAVLEANRGQITAISYSPDGKYIAVGDAQRMILAYDTASHEVKIDQWVFHSSRINSVAWSPDSKHLVSAGLDTNVEVWSVEQPMKHIAIKGAHLDAVTN